MFRSMDPMGVATEELTCRICQLEGNVDHPLFHPCKCRGSIKYIHQDCLEEWLQRSGRDGCCDICHEQYRFTLLFDENTPDVAPFKLIILKAKTHILYTLRYLIAYGKFIFGSIQVPLFWAVSRRFIDWTIDSSTTHDDFLVHLIYGDAEFSGDPYSYENLSYALRYTFVSSLTFLVYFAVIHLSLFLEHEWVSKDEGFQKLINKNIGVDQAIIVNHIEAPRINPENLRAHIIRNQPGEQDERFTLREFGLLHGADLNEVRDARLFLELQGVNANGIHPQFQGLIRPANLDVEEEHDQDYVLNDDGVDDNSSESDSDDINDTDLEDDGHDNTTDDDSPPATRLRRNILNRAPNNAAGRSLRERNRRPTQLEAPQRNRIRVLEDFDDLRDLQLLEALGENQPLGQRHVPLARQQNEQNEADHRARVLQLLQPQAPLAFGAQPHPQPQPQQAPQPQPQPQQAQQVLQPQQAQQVLQPQQAQQERPELDRNADDFFLSLPTFVIILTTDCFLDAYLIVAYLIPSVMGTLIFQICAFLINHGIRLLLKLTDLLKLTPYLNLIHNKYISLKRTLPIIDTFLNDCIIDPVWNVLLHVYEQKGPLTKAERFLPLLIFYSLGFAGLLFFINSKARDYQRDKKSLIGIQRKIYTFVFDLIMTSKVFLIFFIELFLLPTFCGFLLEFALTPIFDTESKLILNDIYFINYYIMVRLAISWACGTGYMCLFALYIGMCRRYILRPGLLYFIRSPEDPNTHLVHDALVRPLYSQLSKVVLGGLVYTLFILIGFGAVTHFLKASGTPLLPFNIGPMKQLTYGFFIGLVAASTIYHRLDVIRKYVRQYWNRAFRISATQTRLCSFILGIPDLKERGYVVYRDLGARFKGAKPDYTKPISPSEAKEIFETTNAQACFVPDGNLVRAPKHDTVSRKFVKNLFIPVTKDDVPLKSEVEIKKRTEQYSFDEFEDSEDEKLTTNSYEIVYRPPLFGLRVICFILLLWIFSVFLICGVLIVSNIIGKPIILLLEGLNKILEIEPYGLLKNINENGFLNALLRIELVPLSSGLGLCTLLLETFDNHVIRTHMQQEGLEDDSFNDRIERIKEHIKNSMKFIFLFLLYFGSQLYIMAWNALVHYKGINEPFKYLEGISSVTEMVVLNKFTFPIHGIVFLFTYFRWFLLVSKDSRDIIRHGDLGAVASKCAVFAITRFVTTHLVVLLSKTALVCYEFRKRPDSYTDFFAAAHYIIVEEAIYEKHLIFIWPAVLLFVGFVHLVIKGFKYFQKINAEVKEEYYSKGKTLENKVISEENLDGDVLENDQKEIELTDLII